MKYKFKNIKIFDTCSSLPILSNTICFHGNPLDERGDYAISLNIDNKLINFKYDDENFNIIINGETFDVDEYENEFLTITESSIIIEATTLSVIDILFILKAIKTISSIVDIQILYIEPKEYNFKNSSILEYDDFELSSKFKEFPPVPGFTILTQPYDEVDEERENTELIAFLGFERTRLGQIFTSDDGATYTKFTPVIPLPGFSPGWENRTISSHLKFFSSKYVFNKLEYVSANNPYHAYKILLNFSKTRNKFRIAPIGTKPNAIGCAIFLLNNDTNNGINSGILFDFPTKIKKRSNGVGKINIYMLIKD